MQVTITTETIRALIEKKKNWVYKFPFRQVENMQMEMVKYFFELKNRDNRKWTVVSILHLIEKIGSCPSFVPKPEMLNLIKRHSGALKAKHGLDIARFHVYFGATFLQDKFELIAKTKFVAKKYVEFADAKGQTLLFHAVRWNNIPLVQYLLSTGFNLEYRDENENTPIFSAIGNIHKKNHQCIDLLVRCGANLNIVNKNGKMPYHVALHRANWHPLILSLQKGIRVRLTPATYKRLPHFIKKYKNIVVMSK